MSNFGLSANVISTADRLEVQDYSYDPQGYNLIGYEWVLKKGNTVVGTYTTKEFPEIDFNGVGFKEGEYTLSLKVTNTANDSSGVFAQSFKVETARYKNQFMHYAVGLKEGEKMLLQQTYAMQPVMMFASARAGGEVTIDIRDQEAVSVNVQVSKITQNHKVRVEFMQEDGSEIDPADQYKVSGKVSGGPGVFFGSGVYGSGSEVEVSWEAPKGYEVEKVRVKVNGVERPYEDQQRRRRNHTEHT